MTFLPFIILCSLRLPQFWLQLLSISSCCRFTWPKKDLYIFLFMIRKTAFSIVFKFVETNPVELFISWRQGPFGGVAVVVAAAAVGAGHRWSGLPQPWWRHCFLSSCDHRPTVTSDRRDLHCLQDLPNWLIRILPSLLRLKDQARARCFQTRSDLPRRTSKFHDGSAWEKR